MTVMELADRLIAEPSTAARLLRGQTVVPGLSRAFFDRVLLLYQTDHASLGRLAPAARAVLRHGDEPALAHRSMAIAALVKGRWSQAANSFVAAGDNAASPLDRFAFKRGAVQALARGGQVEAGLELGRELMNGLESLGETGAAGQVALNMTNALMDQDRYEEAAALLNGLPERLAAAGHLADAAAARLARSTCLLFSADVAEARTVAEAAVREAFEIGFHLVEAVAKRNVAYADILRGDADLAVSSLVELRREFDGSPVELAETLEYLGDAFSAMNLWVEAADAYEDALALGSAVSPLHYAHLRLGIGQTLLAADRAKEALPHLALASARYGRLGNLVWHAAAEVDRAQAERELGRAGATRRTLSAIELARTAGSPYHLVRALLLGGEANQLDEAARILRRYRYPRLLWRVLAAQARAAEGPARLPRFRRAFDVLLEEQARLSSFASRMGYLRDKSDFIRQYLEELLSKPTPRRIEEARQVVSRSRAVALLDELLRAGESTLPAPAVERLRALRAELNDGDTEKPTQSRRRGDGMRGLDRAQRQWVEETHTLFGALSPVTVNPAADSIILFEGNSGVRAIAGDRVIEFPESRNLEAKLEWLSYELLSPMLNRDADPRPAMRELCELGRQVLAPILGVPGTLGISPEGRLWRVPWIACLDALEAERDLELRMHPGFRGDLVGSEKPAMLWVAEHADLKWVREEAEMFLHHFPNAAVCRTCEEVRTTMNACDLSVLHVISHARHRMTHPMFSSLDFTDGPIVAAEIARSGLRAELVTLSGCDTGRVSAANRMEPDGLVRAFLACGAAFVVGSAWPLDDEAAQKLYQSFYSSMSKDLNVHVSLRKARKVVQNWRSHPYFWASPLLYGGYRK